MRKNIQTAGDRISGLVESVLAALFLVAIGLSFFNVVGRYVTGQTYRGGDEVQVFIMVVMTFVGAGVVAWRGQHLRLDLVKSMAPEGVQNAIAWFERCLGVLVCGFVVWVAWGYTARLFGFGMRSDTASLPLWIPHSALVVGFGLICLSYLSLSLAQTRPTVASPTEH